MSEDSGLSKVNSFAATIAYFTRLSTVDIEDFGFRSRDWRVLCGTRETALDSINPDKLVVETA